MSPATSSQAPAATARPRVHPSAASPVTPGTTGTRPARNRPLRPRGARAVRDATGASREGDEDAGELRRAAQTALDTAARRHIIHPNAAARRKSRMAQQLKAVRTA